MLPDGWMVIRDFMDVLAHRGLLYAIYRGQADVEWDLTPSAFREMGTGFTHTEHLQDWKWRAARFAEPLPRDDVEWLILAQHYGIPTPLLDWTMSPLVALFFACGQADEADVDGCVWWINRRDFFDPHDTALIHVFSPGTDRPVLINAVGRNARSTAQDSVLSLHTMGDGATWLPERIFTVPAAEKVETLQALAKLGFSNERLHADITKLVDRFKAEMAGRRLVIER